LHAAAATCRHALEHGPPEQDELLLPATGSVSAVLSSVLLEWNDLAEAERRARQGLRLGHHWGHKDTISISSISLANVLASTGSMAGALEACSQATEAANDLSPWYRLLTEAAEARVRLTLGDLEAASRWAQASRLQANDAFPFREWSLYRTLALVLTAQARPHAALEVLARLLALAELAGAYGLWIQFRVLQALALQAQGRLSGALAALERPLALGEPEGYVRSFIAGGAPAAHLLRAALDRGMAPAYTARLLAACSGRKRGPASHDAVSALNPLTEPLTERERDILCLIAEGCTNHEICARLFLAPGTVKSYTYSLYGKLSVHSRTQAVARARSLGLLPEP
jgi:LuxR family maltose regulon positive regulatory protein